jgi:hypothetical protein
MTEKETTYQKKHQWNKSWEYEQTSTNKKSLMAGFGVSYVTLYVLPEKIMYL